MTARRRREGRVFMKDAEASPQADDFHQRIRALEALRPPGRFVGIVFPSDEPLVAGDNAGGWFLVIPEDLDGTELVHAHAAAYSQPTGGPIELQVRKGAATDMLSTPITIDAGENTSYTAATPPVIDGANAGVVTGDLIVVDIDDPASSAQGLDIILAFA